MKHADQTKARAFLAAFEELANGRGDLVLAISYSTWRAYLKGDRAVPASTVASARAHREAIERGFCWLPKAAGSCDLAALAVDACGVERLIEVIPEFGDRPGPAGFTIADGRGRVRAAEDCDSVLAAQKAAARAALRLGWIPTRF